MFAPVQAPSFIQTVHGLSFKVMRPSQQEENEDPQNSRKSNRLTAESKKPASEQESDSQNA